MERVQGAPGPEGRERADPARPQEDRLCPSARGPLGPQAPAEGLTGVLGGRAWLARPCCPSLSATVLASPPTNTPDPDRGRTGVSGGGSPDATVGGMACKGFLPQPQSVRGARAF